MKFKPARIKAISVWLLEISALLAVFPTLEIALRPPKADSGHFLAVAWGFGLICFLIGLLLTKEEGEK